MAKAGKITFKLNKRDFKQIMAAQAAATRKAADSVASNARRTLDGKDVPVKVSDKVDRNGRPVSMVTIAHASGLARQAKDGVLTRAAASAGLDVKRYD